MKSFISIIFLLNSFYLLNAVIPNWDLESVGENLLTGDSYTYESYSDSWYEVKLTMTRTFQKENGEIKKINKVYMKGKDTGDADEREVDFDNVGNFYRLNERYYICPRGKHHLYDYTGGGYVTPNDFQEVSDYDFRCMYHEDSKVFLAIYTTNGEKAIYAVYIGEGTDINRMAHKEGIKDEMYDFKLSGAVGSNSEYSMIAFAKENKNINLYTIKATLKYDGQNINIVNNPKLVTSGNDYFQATFRNNDTDFRNDFFYVAYNYVSNNYNIFSGYSSKTTNDYSSLNDVEIANNDTPAHFEFFEDLEIDEMKFVLNNRFVYYKLNYTGATKYYGIFDTKLNKIIFNTDEKLTQFFPDNENAMIAVTQDKVYRICPIKDGSNCVHYCANKYYFDTEGNKCAESDSCPEDEVLLVPSGVCNKTCDTNFYIEKDGLCGLCQFFNPSGAMYKLVGGTECLTSSDISSATMDKYNEKLGLMKCREGFKVENNKCVSDIICPENCKTCTTETTCTSCKEDFFLENYQCKEHCSSGYGLDETGKECKNCNVNTCSDFEMDSCNCEKCKEHYFNNTKKKCEECDSNCKDCSNESTNCISCENGNFLLENKCYSCEHGNCEVKESDNCKCKKCKDGFYLINYTCKNCTDNCKTCVNSSSCEVCKDNFYKNTEGNCVACPSNCATKKEDNCKCSTCIEAYFMDNNEECLKCDEQCKTCENSASKCTSCTEINYFLNEKNECELCDSSCQSCSIEKKNCTSCVDGKYLNNSSCEICSEVCLTCSSSENDGNYNCLSCKKASETLYPYLISDDFNHTCVNKCELYERETVPNSYICKAKTNGTINGDTKGDHDTDYVLWIFIAIIAILFLIITICICKKCCNKGDNDFMAEIDTELNEKGVEGEGLNLDKI